MISEDIRDKLLGLAQNSQDSSVVLLNLQKQVLELQRGVKVEMLGQEAQNRLQALLSMTEAARDRVMQRHIRKSLAFADMLDRWERIEPAHTATLRWFMEDQSTASASSEMTPKKLTARTRYIQWLRSDAAIFHLAGKLGSGKSTLMKFLFEHMRTKAELEKWASMSRTITKWIHQLIRHRPAQTHTCELLFLETGRQSIPENHSGSSAIDASRYPCTIS